MDIQTQKELIEMRRLLQEQTKQNDNLRTAVAKLHQELIRTKTQLKRTTENGNRSRKDLNNILQTLSKR